MNLYILSQKSRTQTIFLKPNWATNAVYKILDHPLLNQNNGRFDKEDAKTIWHEDQYAFIHSELLRLMQKFFLTYEIDNSGRYIVPERLPPFKPDYPWNKTGNLFLQYQYDHFMPKGILSQFIVQMHCYISNHDYVWKRGVVLERENTRAEITETYDARSVRIRTDGKNKRDFMTIIAEQFDRINAQYEKMKWEKFIPCNCSECKKAEEPHFYKHKDLKRRIQKGRQEVECEISFEMVNVRSLIDDVISENFDHEETCTRKKPIPGHMKKTVFISYATEDYDTAKRLYDDLKQNETDPWLDRENLLAGQNWRDEIPRVIRESDYFLVLVSSKSVSKKGYVQKEQKIALEIYDEFPGNEIFIIPARTDSTEPLDKTLQNLHWADLSSSYEKGLKQILQSINAE